jgi:hypothetical protein
VALSTDDHTVTTAAESPTAPAPKTSDPYRRIGALAWAGVGVGLAAVAVVSIAALRDDDKPATTDDNARTVIEHGSIAALDHRLEVEQAQRTPSETVAQHISDAVADQRAEQRQAQRSPSETVAEQGSVAAADHRADDSQARRTPSETVAEQGSVAAADHRAEVDATTAGAMAEHADEQNPAYREQMVLVEQSRQTASQTVEERGPVVAGAPR